MGWCGRQGLHFVADEVYGLSEFRKNDAADSAFVSALSLLPVVSSSTNGHGSGKMNDDHASPSTNEHSADGINTDDLRPSPIDTDSGEKREITTSKYHESDIDPSRVHIIWSLSKDLGCSGLRIVGLSPSP